MSRDGLRDEADSLREALPDDAIDRAVGAACDVADWHWEPEYNGEHVLVPSPEDSMEPIVLAVIDSIGPAVAARIDAAREQIAEQIAQAIETAPYPQPETAVYVRKQAVGIARHYAKGDGDE